jgi:hypothetical protein
MRDAAFFNAKTAYRKVLEFFLIAYFLMLNQIRIAAFFNAKTAHWKCVSI